MKKQPLISIIIATYNSDKYIEQCITSVVRQSYKNYELIIIDGKSTDKTVSIIKRFSDNINYWISEIDNGIYDAWNKALRIAKGDWITFIGSDDILHPNALEIYVNHINKHPNCNSLEFISSKINLVTENLDFLQTVGDAWNWELFRRSMITWHVGCFHSKNLFIRYGFFDSTYKISGDYELLLRAKDSLVTAYINEATVMMRTGGTSSKNLIQASEETYRAKIKNGVISPYRGMVFRVIDYFRLRLRYILKNFP